MIARISSTFLMSIVLVLTALGQGSPTLSLDVINPFDPATPPSLGGALRCEIIGPAGAQVGIVLDFSILPPASGLTPAGTPMPSLEGLYQNFPFLRPAAPTPGSALPIAPYLVPGNTPLIEVDPNLLLVYVAMATLYGESRSVLQPMTAPAGTLPLSPVNRSWTVNSPLWQAHDTTNIPNSVQSLWNDAVYVDANDTVNDATILNFETFEAGYLAQGTIVRELGPGGSYSAFVNAPCAFDPSMTNEQAIIHYGLTMQLSFQSFALWNPENVLVLPYPHEIETIPLQIPGANHSLLMTMSQVRIVQFTLGVAKASIRGSNVQVNQRMRGWHADPTGLAIPMSFGATPTLTFGYGRDTFTATGYPASGCYWYFPAPPGLQLNTGSSVEVLEITSRGIVEDTSTYGARMISVSPQLPTFVFTY